jgi:hypothetical protein
LLHSLKRLKSDPALGAYIDNEHLLRTMMMDIVMNLKKEHVHVELVDKGFVDACRGQVIGAG